jgi:hydrogenase-4 component E
MATGLDSILVLVLLLNLFALGASRIRTIILAVAIQGVLLGLLPLILHRETGWRGIAVSLGALALKGIVIPRMLRRAMADLPIRREVEPLVGFRASLILGAGATGVSIFLATLMPLIHPGERMVVATSLATVLTGFLLLTTRLKAITQVLGYLVLENGIYIFGVLLLQATPFLVEVGVLLDLFVAIFVMGIMINHISREFTSISTERLIALKD